MKITTRIEDIKCAVALAKASTLLADRRATAISRLDLAHSAPADLVPAVDQLVLAQKQHAACRDDFASIPKARRLAASRDIEIAGEIARRAALLGGDYSGETTRSFVWADIGGSAAASTHTYSGEQYSRSCKYRKMDARHVVTLDPAGIPFLVDSVQLRAASQAEGLPLIALYPNGSAAWVIVKGKALRAQCGFVAFDAAHNLCYHSTTTLEAAQLGLKKKVASHVREEALRIAASRAERRAYLIARLCGKASATIADAKELGFCEPGIRAFQQSFGIGDEATLTQLIRTGNSSAVRLALHVARKISSERINLLQPAGK